MMGGGAEGMRAPLCSCRVNVGVWLSPPDQLWGPKQQ